MRSEGDNSSLMATATRGEHPQNRSTINKVGVFGVPGGRFNGNGRGSARSQQPLSPPTTHHHTMVVYTVMCAILGHDKPFSIKINSDELVSELKNKIKAT